MQNTKDLALSNLFLSYRFLNFKMPFIFLILFLLKPLTVSAEITGLKVSNGVLDLSELDLDKAEPVELKGEWEFYWKQFIKPEEADQISEKRYLKVPGTWNKFPLKKGNDEKVGGQGYGTYILRLKGLNPELSLSIYLKGSLSAFKATAISFDKNGEVKEKTVSKRGKVGKSLETHEAFDRGGFLDLGKGASSALLVIHVSNYNHRVGGLERKIHIGTPESLSQMLGKKDQISFLVIGVLVIMAIYHFGLFSLRKEDKASLFFAFFCLDIFVRQITAGGYFETFFEEGSNLLFSIRFKIEYLSLYLAGPITIMFIDSAFPGRVYKHLKPLIFIICFIFSVPVLLFEPIVFSNYILFFHPINGLFCLYMSGLLIYAMIKKDEGAMASFLGIAFLALTIINDVLHSTGTIRTGFLVPYGFMGFIFAQSFILSKKFASAHSKSEYLSANLKKEVDRQTSELREKSEKLEEQNEIINTQFDKIKNDLQIAADVMDAMLPELNFENDFIDLKFFFKPADELAGDLYGMEKRGNRLMFWLCDVTGHGVASSMVAGVIREAMAGCRIETLFDESKAPDPAKALEQVSHEVGRSIKGKFFATMTLQVIDFNKKEITFANASHLKPIHFRENIWQKNTVGKIQNGPLIGYVGDAVFGYNNFTFPLKEKDFLFVFTDGLNEASFDHQSEEFGKKRVVRFLKKNLENDQLLTDLFDEVIKFQRKEQLDDDITMAVIKVN